MEKCIRKVKMLQGGAKTEADKQNLKDDDLVILTTTIVDGFPEYQLEKIEGDPVSYLLKRTKEK